MCPSSRFSAHQRQAWLDDYEERKKIRQQEAWDKHLAGASMTASKPAQQQLLLSVDDLKDAGDSEAEAMMDPTHPSGPWGTWVDGPQPRGDDDFAKSTSGLLGTKLHTLPRAAKAPSSPMHAAESRSSKGRRSALHGVDLGSESYAEALVDPSHPSGEWGTWVEPSTSARSVLGKKQYESFVGSSSSLAKSSGASGASALLDLDTKRLISQGHKVLESAAARSGRDGFGMPELPAPKGLGGRYSGRTGGKAADSVESFEVGRLLDMSEA